MQITRPFLAERSSRRQKATLPAIERSSVLPLVGLLVAAPMVGAVIAESPLIGSAGIIGIVAAVLLLTRSGVAIDRQHALILCGLVIAYPALIPKPSDGRLTTGLGGTFDTRATIQLMILVAIAAAAAWLCVTTPTHLSLFTVAPMNLLSIYFIIVSLSLIHTPDPDWALYAVLRLLGPLLIVFAMLVLLHSRAHLTSLIDVMMVASAMVLTVFWLDVFRGAGAQLNGRTSTSWLHPNNATILGATMAVMMGARFLAAGRPAHPIPAVLVVVLVTGLKKTTHSATLRFIPVAVAGLGALYYMVVNNIGIVAHIRTYESNEYLDPTSLTGRTEVWSTAIRTTISDPVTALFGHGYMSTFALGIKGEHTVNGNVIIWDAGQAHNSFIQTFFDLGVVGLIVVVAIFVHAWWSIARQVIFTPAGDSSWIISVQLLAALTTLTIVCFVEDIFGGIFEIRSMLFLLTVFAIHQNGRILRGQVAVPGMASPDLDLSRHSVVSSQMAYSQPQRYATWR